MVHLKSLYSILAKSKSILYPWLKHLEIQPINLNRTSPVTYFSQSSNVLTLFENIKAPAALSSIQETFGAEYMILSSPLSTSFLAKLWRASNQRGSNLIRCQNKILFACDIVVLHSSTCVEGNGMPRKIVKAEISKIRHHARFWSYPRQGTDPVGW